jgi:hypothetical protein
MDSPTQLKLVQNEALELFKRKNKDYGDAFATYGSVGVIVRIGDKISRLLTIERNGIKMVNDERVRDTLVDLHNYAAMAVMLIDEPDKKEDKSYIHSNNHYTQTINDNGRESDFSIAFNG